MVQPVGVVQMTQTGHRSFGAISCVADFFATMAIDRHERTKVAGRRDLPLSLALLKPRWFREYSGNPFDECTRLCRLMFDRRAYHTHARLPLNLPVGQNMDESAFREFTSNQPVSRHDHAGAGERRLNDGLRVIHLEPAVDLERAAAAVAMQMPDRMGGKPRKTGAFVLQQVVGLGQRWPRFKIGGRGTEQSPGRREAAAYQTAVLHFTDSHAGVEPFGDEVDVSVRVTHIEPNPRVAGQKFRESWRNPYPAERDGQTEPQVPGRQGRHRADRFFADAVRAINVAGIKPVIDRTFSFEDTPAAYRFLESGSHFGKVAIDLDRQ